MNLKRKPSLVQFLAGASVAAMGASAPLAMATILSSSGNSDGRTRRAYSSGIVSLRFSDR